jgi:putative nucleotidyltransferase with HDIG domain
VQEIAQLCQEVEAIHGKLASLQSGLQKAGYTLPPEVISGVRQLVSRMITLRETIQNVEENRDNLQALAEIGYVVNSSLDLPTVLNEVIDTIIQLAEAERAFLMLRDPSGALETVVARNWEHESLKPGEYEISRTVINQVVESGQAVLTTNAQEDPRFDGIQSVVAYSLRSILCVPLKGKGELIGVLYADNRVREGIFNENDRTLLSAFANQAAVALENAQLFNDLTISYDQTLDALMAALDVRDQETEGHTRRVVLYSMTLAQKLGLSEDQLLDLRRGAMVHDIGKLGIPDSILLKPGPLTEEEWRLMRQHPELGVRMLEGIVFFKRAIDVIHAHHEHYDGGGYPRALVGDDIPLGARIFAVADALDAITSDRPYRKAQPYAVARKEIRRCRGTQFDPQVVDVFLSIDEEEWEALRSLTIPRVRGKKTKVKVPESEQVVG